MRFSHVAVLLAFVPGTVLAQGRQQTPERNAAIDFKVDLPADDARLTALKSQAMRMVDSMSTFTQQMVDQVFSFAELGFQEEETSKYLTGILEKNGFTITRGVAGIPTAWTAVWRSPAGAKPVISLGQTSTTFPRRATNQVWAIRIR